MTSEWVVLQQQPHEAVEVLLGRELAELRQEDHRRALERSGEASEDPDAGRLERSFDSTRAQVHRRWAVIVINHSTSVSLSLNLSAAVTRATGPKMRSA